MLKVRIELVRDGDEVLVTTVAELAIANDGAESAFTGSYTSPAGWAVATRVGEGECVYED